MAGLHCEKPGCSGGSSGCVWHADGGSKEGVGASRRSCADESTLGLQRCSLSHPGGEARRAARPSAVTQPGASDAVPGCGARPGAALQGWGRSHLQGTEDAVLRASEQPQRGLRELVASNHLAAHTGTRAHTRAPPPHTCTPTCIPAHMYPDTHPHRSALSMCALTLPVHAGLNIWAHTCTRMHACTLIRAHAPLAHPPICTHPCMPTSAPAHCVHACTHLLCHVSTIYPAGHI